MFKEYASKPVLRKAALIGNEQLTKVKDKEATYMYEGVSFKAYEEPQVGDYIVYLNANDIYHCTAEVFEARNIV